ncbi:hypothetical protein PC123_g14817 [Phytophthora cactorum]|nr:hypothetical protein PC120_g14657 [Phytophthora cactorum]KAG4049922.1 hypothetical protein PC123_g14817 [Phytophthora cactorum]
MLATVLENTPNLAIQALSGVDTSDESVSDLKREFPTKRKDFDNKRRFSGMCFCKKPGSKNLSTRRRRPTRDVDKWHKLTRPTSRSRPRVR